MASVISNAIIVKLNRQKNKNFAIWLGKNVQLIESNTGVRLQLKIPAIQIDQNDFIFALLK